MQLTCLVLQTQHFALNPFVELSSFEQLSFCRESPCPIYPVVQGLVLWVQDVCKLYSGFHGGSKIRSHVVFVKLAATCQGQCDGPSWSLVSAASGDASNRRSAR